MKCNEDFTLPPYSGCNGKCPKCGTIAATTWHLTGLEKGFPCWGDCGPIDEHMCRTCPCCGYGWMESTLDADAGDPDGYAAFGEPR